MAWTAWQPLTPIDSITNGSMQPITSNAVYYMRRYMIYDTGLLTLTDNQEKTVTLPINRMYIFVNIHATNGQEIIILSCYNGTLRQTRVTHATQGNDTLITNSGQNVTFKATGGCRGHLLMFLDHTTT